MKGRGKKASVWKRRDGREKGWNTLALCVGYYFNSSFYRLSFLACTVAPPLVPNGQPVSAVRLNGDKRSIYGCLPEVNNLSFY